jgi:transposase
MPAERITMRQAREIIRLKSTSISAHEISRRLGMPRSTVRETLRRAESAGLSWPLPERMNDDGLEAALYADRRSKRGHRRVEEPDWVGVHRELKREHVTLMILWDEYIAENPGGYSYSRFCELYRAFEKTLSVTMRQTHAAGERLFVDYAGDGVPVIIDRLTGEMRMAQIFVAVLGASSLTFAWASWTQTLPDWIDAHVSTLSTIGGVPQLIVPDNAKTAIVKACFYDPQVNRTYADMAAHYGAALLPARPRKPRDKAKVESAVLIVERWLLGRLRRRTFYSLAEVNAAIEEILKTLNASKIGPATAALCEQILEARPHPEQGYRACLGVVRLAGPYGAERVEAAAERAIEIGAKTYGSVKSILDHKLDRKPAPKRGADAAPILHPNIRGPRYYH